MATTGTWELEEAARIEVSELPLLAIDILQMPESEEFKVATATSDGHVYVLSGSDLNEIKTLRGHRGAVHAVAFAPNHKRLFTAGDDLTLRSWDLGTHAFEGDWAGIIKPPRAVSIQAQQLQPIRIGHGQPITSICVLQDEVQTGTDDRDGAALILATGSQDHQIKVWRDASVLRTLDWHAGPITNLEYNHGAEILLSASRDGWARTWRTESGVVLNRFDAHKDEVEAATWLDDDTFVTADLAGTLTVWSTSQDQPIMQFAQCADAVHALCGLDAKHFLVGLGNGDIALYRKPRRVGRKPIGPMAVFEPHDFTVRAIRRVGAKIFSIADDGVLVISNLVEPTPS